MPEESPKIRSVETDGITLSPSSDESVTQESVKRPGESEEQKPGEYRRGRPRDRLRRGTFLLPNIITTGALFSGFYAIIASINGRFVAAAVAIFVAAVLDTLDGRVARWTKSDSSFGAQYDSLSDMVAFGVAPALVVFEWGLSGIGQFGWVAAFIYMACAALRLARYNTSGDNRSFTGLPSPSAAAVLASLIWLWSASGGQVITSTVAVPVAILTVIVALLMVSNIRYYSPKMFGLKGRVPFISLVAVAVGFSLIMLDPPLVLLILSVGYALSGPTLFGWKKLRILKTSAGRQ